MRLLDPTAGTVKLNGEDITRLSRPALRPLRRQMQIIFQDPYASLNPRKTVRQTLEEPLRFHNPKMTGAEIADKIADVMKQVGVDPAWITRYCRPLSSVTTPSFLAFS